MRELAQVVCLDQLAKEKEMELSEEEKEKTAQAAEEYFASLTEDEIVYMGVSESDIKSTMSIMRWHRKCTIHSQKR